MENSKENMHVYIRAWTVNRFCSIKQLQVLLEWRDATLRGNHFFNFLQHFFPYFSPTLFPFPQWGKGVAACTSTAPLKSLLLFSSRSRETQFVHLYTGVLYRDLSRASRYESRASRELWGKFTMIHQQMSRKKILACAQTSPISFASRMKQRK